MCPLPSNYVARSEELVAILYSKMMILHLEDSNVGGASILFYRCEAHIWIVYLCSPICCTALRKNTVHGMVYWVLQ